VAEDVAQIALVRVHRAFAGFRGGSRFSTWLYRLVANIAHDETRRAGRHRRDQEAATARISPRNSLASPGADRIAEILKVLLEQLSPRQRAAFELVDLQGFSGPEAAAMEGIEESTLRVHLARARSAVRTAIEEMLS